MAPRAGTRPAVVEYEPPRARALVEGTLGSDGPTPGGNRTGRSIRLCLQFVAGVLTRGY